MLEESGTLENLRIAAGTSKAEYHLPVFRDSDLYKVLEAVAWERAHGSDPEQERFFRSSVELLEAAQEPDGYINSYVQVVERGRRWGDPAMGHELYCAGHLFQAAVADARTAGQPAGLLPVAEHFASLLVKALRSDQAAFIDGHPEVETALVELYRTTGDGQLLHLASELVGRRGHQSLRWRSFGPEYFQDDIAFDQARSIRGHAVRALYLLAGAADLYTETGTQELLSAAVSQWEDMTSAKTYLTGGVGSRHQDEAFGDRFELPPDRAYCERCAAIASIMWNWRLLLVTGESRYADLMERTLYNGFLAGIGLSGKDFFYVNPLQARRPLVRTPWHYCACCPPNGMRLMASLEHYLATTTTAGIQLHQFASGRLRSELGPRGSLEISVETGYPFAGTIALRAIEVPDGPCELAARAPAWAGDASATLNDRAIDCTPGPDGYFRFGREWSVGDELVIELPMKPRAVRPGHDIDSVRGCVAFERGPLVYCLEGRDVAGTGHLQGISVVAGTVGTEVPGVEIGGQSMIGLDLEGLARPAPEAAAWPYYERTGDTGRDAGHPDARPVGEGGATHIALRAVPYFAWANRGATDMRVWVPEGD